MWSPDMGPASDRRCEGRARTRWTSRDCPTRLAFGTAPVRCETVSMATFVFRLKAPRPTFALDMNDEEREIMGQHAAYWQPYIESGQMVIFGPVLDGTGSWGLGVVETGRTKKNFARVHATRDPVVTSGTGSVEVGRLLAGFVRPPGADSVLPSRLNCLPHKPGESPMNQVGPCEAQGIGSSVSRMNQKAHSLHLDLCIQSIQ